MPVAVSAVVLAEHELDHGGLRRGENLGGRFGDLAAPPLLGCEGQAEAEPGQFACGGVDGG